MLKMRFLILGAMLCLLVAFGGKPIKADGGGACLGQWSECIETCNNYQPWFTGTQYAICTNSCDAQRNKCLQPVSNSDQ
jgi:hypothetical protein